MKQQTLNLNVKINTQIQTISNYCAIVGHTSNFYANILTRLHTTLDQLNDYNVDAMENIYIDIIDQLNTYVNIIDQLKNSNS